MKSPQHLILLALFFSSVKPAQAQSDNAFSAIKAYRVFFGKINVPSGGQTFTLRRFVADNQTYYLSFNPQTFLTAVLPAKQLAVDSLTYTQFRQMTDETVYGKAGSEASRKEQTLQDAGLTHADSGEQGIDLTVDLCPSQRPLTRELFTRLIATFSQEELPIPVSIAITNVWMKEHPTDLAWLRGLERSGKLRITWINHSFTHFYNPQLPLPENFLLNKNTDLTKEVLCNEQAMLEHDLVPSLFFRFPGLVSDTAVFNKILDFGLLPLGSDAWLAKGQKPTNGSIVLVHGNGNEPVGIADFMKLISEKSPLIRQKKWLLYDLEESMMEKEEGN